MCPPSPSRLDMTSGLDTAGGLMYCAMGSPETPELTKGETMKIGVNIWPWQTRPEGLVDIARLVEELGYESVWTSEHLVFPVDLRSRYPYSAGGVPGLSARMPLTE